MDAVNNTPLIYGDNIPFVRLPNEFTILDIHIFQIQFTKNDFSVNSIATETDMYVCAM